MKRFVEGTLSVNPSTLFPVEFFASRVQFIQRDVDGLDFILGGLHGLLLQVDCFLMLYETCLQMCLPRLEAVHFGFD